MTFKLTQADFKHIRGSVILCATLVVVGSVLLYTTQRIWTQADLREKRAQVDQNEIRGKLSRAQDEVQELRNKIAEYHTLTSRGIIGQEHRLDWRELLHRIEQERRIPAISYELQPQRAFESAATSVIGIPASTGYTLMSSPMKMELQLLHEGDLIHLLSDLRLHASALVRPRHCTLGRLAEAGKTAGGGIAYLNASCELDWVTVQEPQS
ncbi:MAG: hypothetical protein JSR19_07490 [Proteobacteria bacterium]|nr:hypothetical protein [Pseudomonadota bacterium]HQR03741.1 hypothetical protein [Rhodocyclaceae bacterium]